MCRGRGGRGWCRVHYCYLSHQNFYDRPPFSPDIFSNPPPPPRPQISVKKLMTPPHTHTHNTHPHTYPHTLRPPPPSNLHTHTIFISCPQPNLYETQGTSIHFLQHNYSHRLMVRLFCCTFVSVFTYVYSEI